MTGDALIAEGRRLARPCVHLRPIGDASARAAVWRGPGQISPPGEDFEHWLTIDCRFLPANIGFPSGCLSVYTEDGVRSGAVAHDPMASLVEARGGQLLYAHATTSLPPLDAVFRYGSPALTEWLTAIGWEPDWGWNGNFPNAEVANDYLRTWHANLPLDGESVFAVLGGWNVPWPDDDWLELVDRPLVVLTLAESEPWVEVF